MEEDLVDEGYNPPVKQQLRIIDIFKEERNVSFVKDGVYYKDPVAYWIR